MSTGKNIRTSVDSGSPVPTQNHSPDQPYYSLNTFYATLLSRTFKSSTEAITFCRDLCSSHGFTVKQEQSTHKNIYVYCSREGLPDSHRNPKVNPQRNRQSQRCECRWRIVLFENLKLTWEFRKSQNADAFIHNHPLLRPDEIKKEWPREVSEKIFELARQRLPTNEIRQQVREQYPDISWDDRRFYNRLSEERQKMKQRDTAMRTIRLVNLSAQICMVNAGSEDLSHYVESKLISLLEDTCRFANVNSNSITMPVPMPPFHPSFNDQDKLLPTTPNSQQSFSVQQQQDVVGVEDHHSGKKRSSSSIKTEIKRENDPSSSDSVSGGSSSRKTSLGSIKPDDTNNNEPNNESTTTTTTSTTKRPALTNSSKKSFETLPKGYLAVPIPEHTFHVKMYSQNSAGDIRRAIFDMQRPSSSATTTTNLPPHSNTMATANPIGSNPHLQYVTTQHREPLRRRRSRALFAPEEDNDSMDLDSSPARKVSRNMTIMDDELDDMSSQSSPSNSTSLLFAAAATATGASGTHTPQHHELNTSLDQQQHLMGQQHYHRMSSSVATTPTGLPPDNSLFYGAAAAAAGSTSGSGPGSGVAIDGSNIYPSSSSMTNRHLQQQQMMYDSTPFVQQQQPSPTHELGLMQQSQHLNERPHSMTTFPNPTTTQLRAQSVSIPTTTNRVPMLDHPSHLRPTTAGFSTQNNFAQLQTMMVGGAAEDNDGKQRYYSTTTYRDTLQQPGGGGPSSPIPPRPTSTQQQHMISSASQQYLPQPQNEHMFSNTTSFHSSSSPHHQHVFPNTTPYITNEQILQQQQQEQEKRKQQQQQQQQQYNLSYQQQFERQQQQQHMYRRASGPG